MSSASHRPTHAPRRSLVVLCCITVVATVACEESVYIATAPELTPRFDENIADYVTRCAEAPIQVSVFGPADASVSVDGRAVTPGSSTDVTVSAGQAFPIDVTLAGGATKNYFVRCLPGDFPQFAAERPHTPQAEWYVAAPWGMANFQPVPPGTSTQFVGVFDNRGVPLWWRKSTSAAGPLDAKLLPNGNLAWLHFASDQTGAGGGSEERRLDGTLVRSLQTVGSPVDHHEYLLLPNGNYAMGRYFPREGVDLSACGGPTSGVVTDNDIQEIAPDGSLVWSWLASEHIALSELAWTEPCSPEEEQHDIYHWNSIEPDGDAFIVSFRHLNAVYKIARSGDIVWKLGGSNRPESLMVVGDPIVAAGGSLFGGQHDARLLPDRTLTVYDNRTNQADDTPRAVRFLVDEALRTATLVESVTDAAAEFSLCCGSARKLPTGNWVMAWGARPHVTELAPDGSLVFRLHFTQDMFTYRAHPVMPGVLARAALRAGMEAQNPR